MYLRRVFSRLAALLCSFSCALLLLSQPASAFFPNQPAQLVQGQGDFQHNTPNLGGVSANSFSHPEGVIVVNGKMIVSDTQNHRVLIWNSIPSSNATPPDIVLGQVDFSGGTANQGNSSPDATTMSSPIGLASDGVRLYVADSGNNRVLIWKQIPTLNATPADFVVGQASMTAKNPGTTQSTLSGPTSVFVDTNTGKLFVGDRGNNRVLIWNGVPTSNGVIASVVLGQADFTHGTALTVSSASMNSPDAVLVAQGRLFIATEDNRVLIWNSIPKTSNTAADAVLGQADFTHGSANRGLSAPTASTMSLPIALTTDNKNRLYVTDRTNQRILVYSNLPTSTGTAADAVIGQPSFVTTLTGLSGQLFASPYGIATSDGGNLYVADELNHRVLQFSDAANATTLSLNNNPEGRPNNLLRLRGSAQVDSNYSLKSVEYSANSGPFVGATPVNGSFSGASGDYYFDFDPKTNNNLQEGYTVRVKATSSNLDVGDNLMYFQPFRQNSPVDFAVVKSQTPTFSFSINKQTAALRGSLQNFQIWVKKGNGSWRLYMDSIPVDFDTVKNAEENIQRTGNANNGNGVYETVDGYTRFSDNNGTIEVRHKLNGDNTTFENGGKLLTGGIYQWKVVAIDKSGHTQETAGARMRIRAATTSEVDSWFPLQVNAISGVKKELSLTTTLDIDDGEEYDTQVLRPTFSGVAPAGSIVTLELTNVSCQSSGGAQCMHKVTTQTAPSSKFGFTLDFDLLPGVRYAGHMYVSQNDNYNQLPDFFLVNKKGKGALRAAAKKVSSRTTIKKKKIKSISLVRASAKKILASAK